MMIRMFAAVAGGWLKVSSGCNPPKPHLAGQIVAQHFAQKGYHRHSMYVRISESAVQKNVFLGLARYCKFLYVVSTKCLFLTDLFTRLRPAIQNIYTFQRHAIYKR